MQLFIIKIGGSVCTEKEKEKAKIRKKIVSQIGREIRRAGLGKKFKLVIVHGSGSFGHALVKRYPVKGKIRSLKQWKHVHKIQNSVFRQNQQITELLRKEGIPAMGIVTHEICIQNNEKIDYLEVDAIRVCLKNSRVPVVYGDMVMDRTLGASVISSDALVPYLAKKLKAKKAFYGTDVTGIYAGNPKKNKGAKLVPKITNTNYRTILRDVGGSTAVDVTGGMRGKLELMHNGLKRIPATIFDMKVKGNTYKALKGALRKCTVVKF